MRTAGFWVSSYTSYFSSKEINTVSLKKNARRTIALIYPNSYALGMSNLGVHAVYDMLNKRPDTLCERFFFEPKEKEFLSIENKRPLKSFDILAFSISYELDFLNFFSILRRAQLLNERGTRTAMPLIIVGGAVNAPNPFALSRFVDAVFVGEAEESLPVFMDTLARFAHIDAEKTKERFLRDIAGEPGIFVPGISSPKQAAPRFCRSLNDYPVCSKVITPLTEFSNTFLIEISRGCPWGCSFCVTGSVCGAFRPRKLETLIPLIEEGRRYTRKIGLVGAAVSDHPEIDALVAFLRERALSISVSSLRVETVRKPLLKALAGSGQQTVTFAPEAGSERLRRLINKNITDAQLMEKIALAQQCGIKKVKLYFMVGLPHEQEDDIRAIIALAKTAARIIPVKINAGIFVPKLKTPFAEEMLADKKIISRRLKMLKQQLAAEKNITVQTAGIQEAVKEALFSKADENFFSEYFLRR
jgi:radical SAM superfamily enzyme YgiQ (UPF0313 family)